MFVGEGKKSSEYLQCNRLKKSMRDIIHKAEKDPLGAMMLDYLNGRQDAFVEVDSTTLEMWTMRGETMFRSFTEMDDMEQSALQLCQGKILDVGAGAGCHSLYLQQKNRDVDALDISPGCIQVMAQRQVKNIIHQNLFSLTERKYTTILMLMNGLGICGTLDGCNLFLQFIKTMLAPGGQVIAESTDLVSFYEDLENSFYSLDRYYGETEFVMKYQSIASDPFNWLYIDFKTLETLVVFNGLQCEQIVKDTGGKYLVRIFR